jgi:hypothetical protein
VIDEVIWRKKKREKICIYGIGYHLAMYGLRKELLEIKDSRQIEKQKRLYRLEGKKQTGPPKRLPCPNCSIKERQHVNSERGDR